MAVIRVEASRVEKNSRRRMLHDSRNSLMRSPAKCSGLSVHELGSGDEASKQVALLKQHLQTLQQERKAHFESLARAIGRNEAELHRLSQVKKRLQDAFNEIQSREKIDVVAFERNRARLISDIEKFRRRLDGLVSERHIHVRTLMQLSHRVSGGDADESTVPELGSSRELPSKIMQLENFLTEALQNYNEQVETKRILKAVEHQLQTERASFSKRSQVLMATLQEHEKHHTELIHGLVEAVQRREMVQSLLTCERQKVGIANRKLTTTDSPWLDNSHDRASLQLDNSSNALTTSSTPPRRSPTPVDMKKSILPHAKECDLSNEEADTLQKAVTKISSATGVTGVDMSLFQHEKMRSGHAFLLRQARGFQDRISELENEWRKYKLILDDAKYADEGDDETVMDESIANNTSLLVHARFEKSKVQSEYQISRQRLKECSTAIESVERLLCVNGAFDGGDKADLAATQTEQVPQDQCEIDESAEKEDSSRRTMLQRLDRCAELVYTLENSRRRNT